jgi:hypothetical protein
MTYADKLVDQALEALVQGIKEGIKEGRIGIDERHEAMFGELKELCLAVAEKAMQAQKQADAEAVLEVIQMESGHNFNMGFYSRMQQAIFQAEVKI